MSDLTPFELTQGEKNHPLWIRLKAHFEAELEILRARNDSAMTDIQTATLRGQIKFCKAVVRLGEDRPQTGD